MKKVLAISVERRKDKATKVQGILTDFGEVIALRVGCHEQQNDREGLILVLAQGEQVKVDGLIDMLRAVEGVTVDAMVVTG